MSDGANLGCWLCYMFTSTKICNALMLPVYSQIL
jgi:hypothetical protein